VTVKSNYIVDSVSMCLYLPYTVVIHNTCYINGEKQEVLLYMLTLFNLNTSIFV